MQAHQQLGQALGVNFPLHVGDGQAQVFGRPRLARADNAAGVIVHAHKIQGLLNRCHVARVDCRHLCAKVCPNVFGVFPQQQCVQVPTHQHAIFKVHFLLVLWRLSGCVKGREVQHNAQGRGQTLRTQCLYGNTMADQQMVGHLHGHSTVFQTRGKDARVMPEHGNHPRLVVGGQGSEAMAKPLAHLTGVSTKMLDGVRVVPTPFVLQRLWQIPMVQSEVCVNAPLCQSGEQPIVKSEPRFVPVALALRLNARPSHGKTIRSHPQLRQQVQVFFQSVVVVTGNAAVTAIGNVARCRTKGVPYRWASAVFARSPLDLKRSRGHPPLEGAGKRSALHVSGIIQPYSEV